MKIEQIEIKNFRLLRNVDLFLDERTTVIVGRNNSGKTSLTELFRRLSTETPPTFRLEDFSLSVLGQFWQAFELKHQSSEEDEIREKLPIIEVRLTIQYDKEALDWGSLSDFIIDVNPDCTTALIIIRYRLKDGEIDAFLGDLDYHSEPNYRQKVEFNKKIKERIEKHYACSVFSIDCNDSTNTKQLEWSKLRALIQSQFINAQRGLDDVTDKERNVLGKILETFFKNALSESADPKDRGIAVNLEESVKSVQEYIDGDFKDQLTKLLPAFSLFGYPGLSDPRLGTETTLDVQRLLVNHTKVHYIGIDGVNLPETFNGLGVRNLIYILLKLLEFFKYYMVKQPAPGINLIFIEEPEVHLHPQMQEVFINKLADIVNIFTNEFSNGSFWPVQFVVTTHSSHLANRASFESMRYFHVAPDAPFSHVCSTRIKDLRKGLGGIEKDDKKFLHQYMTLTRCDLLFADRAVLIEGMTERLLLPKMIQVCNPELTSQYLSVVEIGGAYAHRFFALLDFLELRTLIITDLDAAKKNDENKLIQCKVSEGTHTTNACIKKWFEGSDSGLPDLLQKSEGEKTVKLRRLAYQVPETIDAPCGRSFEDTFILANKDMFGLSENAEDEAWEKAKERKKSDFALEYAIEKTEWRVPRYIEEGIKWLAEKTCCEVTSPPLEAAVTSPENSAQKEATHA